jgi:hypothetical protein
VTTVVAALLSIVRKPSICQRDDARSYHNHKTGREKIHSDRDQRENENMSGTEGKTMEDQSSN